MPKYDPRRTECLSYINCLFAWDCHGPRDFSQDGKQLDAKGPDVLNARHKLTVDYLFTWDVHGPDQPGSTQVHIK